MKETASSSAPSAVKPAIKMSSTLALNTRVNDLLAAGESVYHLGFGESRFPAHPKILAALRAQATARAYLPVAGLRELRANVAAFYGRKFQIEAEAERVLVGAGSKSLIFAALQALAGDLLLPQPSWVSYETQAHMTGKWVTWIPTTLDEDYCLTPVGLRSGIEAARRAGQSPRVLILNSPHNPSGVIYSSSLLAGLAEVARAEGVVIISDEIYALTAYGGPHTSIARYYPEGTIITGGLSKHLSLGGWRLGVAVLPPGEFGAALSRYMSAVAGAIWTTPAAPIQYAAVVAYSEDPDIEAYVQTCAQIHGQVTQYLYQVMRQLNVPCPRPGGGFYLYPSFDPWREQLARQHGVQSGQDLARLLLDEERIAALPGADFGDEPRHLRLRLASSYLYALDDAQAEAVLDLYRQGQPAQVFLEQACPQVIEVGERFKAFIEGLAT